MDTPPTNTAPQGFFPWVMAKLFGARAERLREQLSHAHWLSYLLIISQSITVVLVFGHVEVTYLFSPNLSIRLTAALALFVLIITVWAADQALIATMTRIPALKRNRQTADLFEHYAYQYFVLAVEGATLGVVLYTLDSDPQALAQGRSLIPLHGPIFLALVVMRVVMVSWSFKQLIIIKERMPVLLSTLMNTGREIVGAHNERQLRELDVRHIAPHVLTGVYAEMTRPPRPIDGVLNRLTGGWIVKRALAREAEEERQANNVINALRLVTPSTSPASAQPAPTALPDVMGTAAQNTVHLPPSFQPSFQPSYQSSYQPQAAKPLSPREERRLALLAGMDPEGFGTRGHPTSPRGAVVHLDDTEDEYDLSDLDDWSDEDERILRGAPLPEMSNHTGKRERAQAARVAPRGAELAVREFIMPDLPASKYEQADDTDQTRAVLRVLDADPRATRREVMERAGVSDGTARRATALWKERHAQKGRKKIATRTVELPAVTATTR